MKKGWLFVISAVFGLSLTACANGSSRTSSEASQTSTVSGSSDASDYELAENEQSRIVVRNGNQILLLLRANPTTGYSWVADDDGNDMFEINRDDYVEDKHPGETTGIGGTEMFYITVLASGDGGLVFEYKQDWDSGESDGKYYLHVTANEEDGNTVITYAEFTKLENNDLENDDTDTSSSGTSSLGNQANGESSGSSEASGDIAPMVCIDGALYSDTGYISSAVGCGNMDGEITSSVDAAEWPTENGMPCEYVVSTKKCGQWNPVRR